MIIDRLIKHISDNYSRDEKERKYLVDVLEVVLIFGAILASGFGILAMSNLVFALVSGIIFTIIFIFIISVEYGLIFALKIGLVGLLVCGSLFVSVFGLGNFIVSFVSAPDISTLIFIGILIIIPTEMLFWLDKKQPKKNESIYVFTIKRKLLGFGEAILIIGGINGGINLIFKYVPMLEEFLIRYGYTVCGIIGCGIVVIIVGAIYIWLNSLKYSCYKRVSNNGIYGE